jgi:hypothetical protein
MPAQFTIPRIKAMMLGAPKPTAAPMSAKIKWDRAFWEPAKNDKAAKINPRIPTRGNMTVMSFVCMAARLDSTLQNPRAGKATTTKIVKASGRNFKILFMRISFR